jgi:hypothetical protein
MQIDLRNEQQKKVKSQISGQIVQSFQTSKEHSCLTACYGHHQLGQYSRQKGHSYTHSQTTLRIACIHVY